MKIRKQYSLAYQVLELERDVETLEEAELVSQGFDAFAEKELNSMVELVSALGGNQNNNQPKQTKIYNNNFKSNTGGELSDKQIATIINQLPRCKGIAKELGITTLNTADDVKNLTKEQGSAIIGKMFEKKTGF